jgi:hypothetical protein
MGLDKPLSKASNGGLWQIVVEPGTMPDTGSLAVVFRY